MTGIEIGLLILAISILLLPIYAFMVVVVDVACDIWDIAVSKEERRNSSN